MSILRYVSKKLNEQAGQVSNSEIAELRHEFSVTQQRLDAEIEAHGATITREAQLSLKLKAAEARIKVLQDRNQLQFFIHTERTSGYFLISGVRQIGIR